MVYRLEDDPYGFIWMVSDKRILIFNGKTFETIKIPGKEQEVVNICRYKNKVYASSYAGKLYEIDMLTRSVQEVLLPENATPFLIMNVIDNKLYLVKYMSVFIILDLKKNKKPILLSHKNFFFRYIIHTETYTNPAKKRWNNSISYI